MVTSGLPGGVKAKPYGRRPAGGPDPALTPGRMQSRIDGPDPSRGTRAREKPRQESIRRSTGPDGVAPYFQIGAASGIIGATRSEWYPVKYPAFGAPPTAPGDVPTAAVVLVMGQEPKPELATGSLRNRRKAGSAAASTGCRHLSTRHQATVASTKRTKPRSAEDIHNMRSSRGGP